MTAYTIETGIRKMHILENSNEFENAIPVSIRLIFLRIGEIDTQKEVFEAHVAIEARWFYHLKENEQEFISSLSSDDQAQLNNGKIVKLPEDYSEKHWHPQLFILNLGRDHDKEIKYSMKKVASYIEIREFHDLNGNFYSKFDLHHFPNDIQQLNISIGSALFDTEVLLQADPNRASGINREAFIDQQEWKLYDHVDTQIKFLKGFVFQNDDDDELDTPGHERKRSIIIMASHAARRSSYFYWNGYCLIFLITLISFSSFAIPPNGTQNRISITCTLLLTSIAFRWTISKSLPTISYLTTIDRYAIVSLVVLLSLCAWHAIVGSIVYIHDRYDALNADSRWAWLDRAIFFAFLGLYMIIHIAMGLWQWRVPFRKRNEMKQLDDRYKQIVEKQRTRRQSLYSTNKDVDQLV
ncbi:hypothetical protein I4U23_023637 [Adineta vaga]|nr:hypothetical protein I4U23_023637 [Adineta vaga]